MQCVPLVDMRALAGQDCADCPRLRHTYSDAKAQVVLQYVPCSPPDMLQSTYHLWHLFGIFLLIHKGIVFLWYSCYLHYFFNKPLRWQLPYFETSSIITYKWWFLPSTHLTLLKDIFVAEAWFEYKINFTFSFIFYSTCITRKKKSYYFSWFIHD